MLISFHGNIQLIASRGIESSSVADHGAGTASRRDTLASCVSDRALDKTDPEPAFQYLSFRSDHAIFDRAKEVDLHFDG